MQILAGAVCTLITQEEGPWDLLLLVWAWPCHLLGQLEAPGRPESNLANGPQVLSWHWSQHWN